MGFFGEGIFKTWRACPLEAGSLLRGLPECPTLWVGMNGGSRKNTWWLYPLKAGFRLISNMERVFWGVQGVKPPEDVKPHLVGGELHFYNRFIPGKKEGSQGACHLSVTLRGDGEERHFYRDFLFYPSFPCSRCLWASPLFAAYRQGLYVLSYSVSKIERDRTYIQVQWLSFCG